MAALTRVEQYVISKNWEYRSSGNQIILDVCPFCHKDGFKFFINEDNFLYDCKRPDCVASNGGNERVLKNHMGDRMDDAQDHVVEQKDRKVKKIEAIPNFEQAHQWLLEETGLMNYLNDEKGWDFDLVSRMKIGTMNRWIADEEKEIGCISYPYIINGKCEFVKFRTLPGEKKNFSSLQGRDVPLYNQDAVKPGMEYLILCEGEADTISVLSLGEEHVVGVPGAGMKQVTWDKLLDYPGKLYLLFDNDEDGQKGARGFAERFGIDKFHNIVIPEFDLVEPVEDKHGLRTKGKDVTEWIAAGNGPDELKELLDEAELYALDGIYGVRKALSGLRYDIETRGDNLPKYDTPWPSLNEKMGGAEDGQLIIIQAAQKTGKTSMALDWADYLVTTKEVNVLFECLEMTEAALVRKWASYVTESDDSPGNLQFPQLLEMLDKADEIAKERDHEILFGYTKVTTLEAEFERLYAIIRRYGVKVWFFDNLQYLVDRTYEGQKQGNRANFMGKVTKMFKELAMETKTLGVLIAQTKGIDEDAMATASSLEGSRSPGNDCDTMLVMNRAKLLKVKDKSDLMKMAATGESTFSTATLAPELFISVDLTRFASGGLCVLMIDGSRSRVYERDKDAALQAQIEGRKGVIGGMVHIPLDNSTGPEVTI